MLDTGNQISKTNNSVARCLSTGQHWSYTTLDVLINDSYNE